MMRRVDIHDMRYSRAVRMVCSVVLTSIKSSSASSQYVDIFISNAWPASITEFSSAPLPAPELASIGVEPVSEVVKKTKPRYHFAAGGGHPPRFWEREPYTWDGEEDKGRVSRFVSLGAFGGEQPPGKKPRVRRSLSLKGVLYVWR